MTIPGVRCFSAKGKPIGFAVSAKQLIFHYLFTLADL